MTLISLARDLERSDDIASLWDDVLSGLSEHGVTCVIYLTVGAAFEAPYILTNVPQIYDMLDPASDPFLHHCCTSYDITPTGPAFLSQHTYLDERARQFIERAAETGFCTGLGIPMRLTGSSRFGGFNLGTGYDVCDFKKYILPKAENLRLFCLLVHRRIEELSQQDGATPGHSFRDLLVAPPNDVFDVLSPREKEVIYLIARGISRKECAQLCGISPNTVAEYTKSAYRKLGVKNRVEAAHLVMKHTPDLDVSRHNP